MFGPNIDHPGHHRTLFSWTRRSNYPVPFKCNGCTQDVEPEGFYCPEEGCEFYLDYTCAYFGHGDYTKIHHPLHPLTFHFESFPNHQTEACLQSFEDNLEILSKYEFRHFFHCHENHTLLPHIFPDNFFKYPATCQGCGKDIWGPELLFKCRRSFECKYYLHIPCSRVPKEMNHLFHPQHTVTLLERPPDDIKQGLHCVACCKRIEDEFVLHCTGVPSILTLDVLFESRP
ncbi:hypothetical protein FEM48_Zijuj10G0011900 [Ziziphus jujuba var. spinosa]|uniref:Phorbol-ester/DAG-type domain-containing protein n=1 Tax=Ziziphus jujuba var. spinosa TaxID=714518 RepID=A0A978UKE6_ZIZJJ|nr:hypothetical protein FEM48_Zijuj10G0011900 [Ziziphus jujuba var. spinosa]